MPPVLFTLGRYTLLLAAYPYGGATPSDIYAEALRGPPFYPQASFYSSTPYNP